MLSRWGPSFAFWTALQQRARAEGGKKAVDMRCGAAVHVVQRLRRDGKACPYRAQLLPGPRAARAELVHASLDARLAAQEQWSGRTHPSRLFFLQADFLCADCQEAWSALTEDSVAAMGAEEAGAGWVATQVEFRLCASHLPHEGHRGGRKLGDCGRIGRIPLKNHRRSVH